MLSFDTVSTTLHLQVWCRKFLKVPCKGPLLRLIEGLQDQYKNTRNFLERTCNCIASDLQGTVNETFAKICPNLSLNEVAISLQVSIEPHLQDFQVHFQGASNGLGQLRACNALSGMPSKNNFFRQSHPLRCGGLHWQKCAVETLDIEHVPALDQWKRAAHKLQNMQIILVQI